MPDNTPPAKGKTHTTTAEKIELEKALNDLKGKNKNENDDALKENDPPQRKGEFFSAGQLSGTVLSRSSPLCHSEEEDEGSYLWLITFTDVMALMLTFFVLLYSMSTPAPDEWEEITTGLNRYFGRYQSPEWYEGPQDDIDITKLDFSNALDLNYLRSLISSVISKNSKLKGVKLFPQKDGLVISFPDSLLFEAGKSKIFPEGKQALFLIGGSLANIRNRIEVVGHADPRMAEKTKTRSSNWELSLLRAISVGKILKDVGYDRPVITRGLSSARYDELPEDWSEKRRQDLSRRVDILIMKDDGSARGFMTLDQNDDKVTAP